MTGAIKAKKVISIILALCIVLTAAACGKTKAEQPEVAASPSASPELPSDQAPATDSYQYYDILVSVPRNLEHYEQVGAVKSLEVNFNADQSWLSVFPTLPPSNAGTDFAPLKTDASGKPVLTLEQVLDHFSWHTDADAFTVLSQDTLTVGGKPAASMSVEGAWADSPDETWRIELTRVVYNGIAYDFLYASCPKFFDKYRPEAEAIIASARFSDVQSGEKTAFENITLSLPLKTAGYSKIKPGLIQVSNSRVSGRTLSFFARYDDTELYTENMLSDQAQLDRLIQISLNKMVDTRFKDIQKLSKISVEHIYFDKIPAVHAVYRLDWAQSNPAEYLESYLFVYKNDLYLLQGKCDLGNEEALNDFIDPIVKSIGFVEVASPKKLPLPRSETVRWINSTYAILTISNRQDTALVGGFQPSESNRDIAKSTLKESWFITNRASSDAVIAKLTKTGHRASFLAFIKRNPEFELNRQQFKTFLDKNSSMDQDTRLLYQNFYDDYHLYGDNAIFAWDYCRIISLYGWGYIAGYYTYSEALDLSLPYAKKLQETYPSWEAMYRDYLTGFNFWRRGSLSKPTSENFLRLLIMQDLINRTDGPNALPPWDMKLEADWQSAK
ncbi:MAG: DUF1266 domain-containing protein [Firmicutes bacterium]|nr:DUF1266 domain-containing protein [Bacillota bacterium]